MNTSGSGIHQLKDDILSALYCSSNIDQAINETLGMVGKYFNVSRVYIFENSEDDLVCDNTYEWCNEGVEPEIQNLQGLRYLEDLGGTYHLNFDDQGLFFCPTIQVLPKEQREVLEPQGIYGMLQTAILEGGKFKGYIGFDNCNEEEQSWENDQEAVDALVFISRLLTLFLLEQRNRKRLENKADELERFTGYICKANAKVLEVNLDTNRAKTFQLVEDGGGVQIEEVPFDFVNSHNVANQINEEDFQKILEIINEENYRNIIDNEEERYFECRMMEGGKEQWFSFTLKAIPKDQEHPNNMIIFKRNIDEVKREEERKRQALQDALEEANYASKSKGNFMSRMSHEIRTPLNAIIGYLDMASLEFEDTVKIHHYIENSQIASRHLLHIINDVLDISSIESGKMKIANEDFDLKALLTSITTIFYNQAREKGIKFEVVIKDLTQEWVVGDSLRLNQVLMNLLSNALKFTKEDGTIRVTVAQLHIRDGRVYMKFDVSDTGIGMSPEYLPHIFEAFEQENATTAKKFGGTGLGLSITQNLVTMMGGNIQVTSKEGEGSTFTVHMNFQLSEENGEEHTVSDFSQVRTLVVDDEQSTLDYVQMLLKRCGVKSDVVDSGEKAIKQIQRRLGSDYEYDLCIIDWNMPELNGIETARKIKSLVNRPIPIIIATAFDTSEFAEEAKDAGVDRIIAKPLFQSSLFDLLVSTFGKYEPKKEEGLTLIQLEGMHILLAEDNEMNMEIAVAMLERYGIVVTQAMDGQEAYDIYMKNPKDYFDAILMDVQMPNVDGYKATKLIRSSGKEDAKTVPIIAMTANAFREDVTAALAAGMNDHIAKPVEYKKLLDALSKCEKHRR